METIHVALLLKTFLVAFHSYKMEPTVTTIELRVLRDIDPASHCLSPLLIKY